MRDLSELLERLDYRILQGKVEGSITDLVYDSRKATAGCMFICIVGTNVDGHSFAAPVADVGAKVIVAEHPVDVRSDVTVLQVKDTRAALALLSAAYFDYPSEDVTVIGITGTKGKTTTTYMIQEILRMSGKKVGLIGTIEAVIGDEHIPAKNTTPESYEVQDYLSRMRAKGIDTCVMEVSSQGLMMHRVDGIRFELGIFTNIEPDHIGPGEHKDFDDYLSCKAKLFRKCKKGIFNADDEHLPAILAGAKCQEEFFGFGEDADFRAEDVELCCEGGMLGVKYHVSGLLDFDVRVNVPGRFSVYNSLTAIAVCHHFGVAEDVMKKALTDVRVRGRIELIPVSDKYSVMIDYAHNAMSLRSLLTTLREYEPERIVTLFGCGGNRSKDRRYEMGEVSGELSDLTIITSDNPRFEEPQDIIDDIKFGINKTSGEYVEIIDRKDAIKYAIENAKEGDVIVLAGKGHEDYQEIRGKKYPMDERDLIHQVMDELGMKMVEA